MSSKLGSEDGGKQRGSPSLPKRRREGANGSPQLVAAASPALAPKGCPPLDLRGIGGCRPLREVNISQYPSRAGTGKNLPPNYKLRFINSLTDEIFTKKEVLAANGGHIKIKMDVSNQQGSSSPRLLSANVNIVVLDGDFNADNREGWTSEEFDNHIVRPRDKVGAVITGKLHVQLENGEADLRGVTFIDNSRFTRSGKFRLGVRLTDDLGETVQQGITEPFTVKDRRSEGSFYRLFPCQVWSTPTSLDIVSAL